MNVMEERNYADVIHHLINAFVLALLHKMKTDHEPCFGTNPVNSEQFYVWSELCCK